MQEQYVKPVILVSRHEHAHSIASQFEMHALVLDIANPIQSKLRVALFEEHRFHSNTSALRFRLACGQIDLPHVIDQTGYGQHIESTKSTFL